MICAIQQRFMKLLLAALLAGVVLFCPKFAPAQNAQGTIVGHVADPSGAVLVGAKVTVRNLDTGNEKVLATNSDGDYVVPALDPGKYSVSVEAQGFSKQVSGNVVLEVQQTLRQDFKLVVGSVSNTVEVSAHGRSDHRPGNFGRPDRIASGEWSRLYQSDDYQRRDQYHARRIGSGLGVPRSEPGVHGSERQRFAGTVDQL